MPGFVCDKCETIDNTRLGLYWSKIKEGPLKDFALCCACVPKEHGDMLMITKPGVWHDQFERRTWAEWGFTEDVINRKVFSKELIVVREKEQLGYLIQDLKKKFHTQEHQKDIYREDIDYSLRSLSSINT